MPYAQVFGPTTIDPGFTSTGEKTLLTMATSLPAGGKNVIIVMILPNASLSDKNVQATFRIKKGTTILYGSYVTQWVIGGGDRAKPPTIVAVDDAPVGNDTYTFTINITTAGTSTGSIHVQGMVFKASDAYWTYNTSAVTIANNATSTVLSLNTSFPSGTKVAIIGIVYGYNTSAAHSGISGGNIRLKSGTTIVSSNQFKIGSYQSIEPFWAPLIYTETTTSSSQTYSIEIYNDSGYTYGFYAEILAFKVNNAAFLDTGSVALTSGSQVTVGNLSTTLSGDVVVIALTAAENTGSSTVTAFNADDVVLQLNNSSTGQISNQVGWLLEQTGYHGRSGIISMFRFDTGVSNPSYQVKMTARASGINGEAKILAFIPMVGVQYTVELSETVSLSEYLVKTPMIVRSESLTLTDTISRTASFYCTFTETVSLTEYLAKTFYKTLTETISLSDFITALKVYICELVETIHLTDTVSKLVSIVKTEAVSLADTLQTVKTLFITLVESIHLTDTMSKAVQIVKTEVLSLVDTLSTLKVFLRVLTETINLTDSVAAIRIRKTIERIKGVTRILKATREKPAERELGK